MQLLGLFYLLILSLLVKKLLNVIDISYWSGCSFFLPGEARVLPRYWRRQRWKKSIKSLNYKYYIKIYPISER